MNGSPRRTRSSFEFWFAIALASFSLNRPSTRSPVMPANPSPWRADLAAGRRGGSAWRGRAAHRRPADLTAMRYLIRPALPVPPPVLVAAFGIGLPAARSRSSHGSLLCACGVYSTLCRGQPRWHSYVMAKEIDRVRAQSALAVIKQHPGMVLFAVSPAIVALAARVVVLRRGLGRAAADRDGGRRRRRVLMKRN